MGERREGREGDGKAAEPRETGTKEKGKKEREGERGKGRKGERRGEGERGRCQSTRELMGWCTNFCLLFGQMFGIATRRKSILFVCRARR